MSRASRTSERPGSGEESSAGASAGAPAGVRVRFAPSPTGALHIGGARTALFNWLFARHGGGKMILRIEDTDRERSTPENVAQILDSLTWLELDWDEGPIMQTDRTERHQEALQGLLASGRAYRSEATAEDVRAFKEAHGAERGFRGEPAASGAVRLRVGDEGATIVRDIVRGDTTFEHRHLDDPVIARADGSVLYNFAVAIDDLDSQITHVIRGEDHLSNTPKQLLVLEACREIGFGPDLRTPRYAHLPLLHGPDGKKLSKRHGAASVGELRAAGYLPAAIRNYLALLGWGAGDDATVLSTEELIERFTLERVSRNPARFAEEKLRWLDGIYVRRLDLHDLSGQVREFLLREGLADARELDAYPGMLAGAVRISVEKIQTLADFWPLAGFFFRVPELEEAAVARWLGEPGREILAEAGVRLEQAPDFEEGTIEEVLGTLVEEREAKPREVYQPLRVALAGRPVSPGIFETVALLGRELTLERIARALNRTA